MWIFTSKAYLSIVVHKNDSSIRLVRARSEGDIEAIFPDADVFEDAISDYRYRAVIPVDNVACVLAKHVLEMDYTNFKNSIPDEKHDYHNACMNVWSVMRGLQR